jgi:hypothetical protein
LVQKAVIMLYLIQNLEILFTTVGVSSRIIYVMPDLQPH